TGSASPANDARSTERMVSAAEPTPTAPAMTNLSPLSPVSRADEAPGPDSAWAPAGLASMDFQLPADGHADARRTLAAAAAILEQGEDLLAALTAEAYTHCVPLAFN